MEEKLNEKRQELHPPQFSEKDRNAHAVAMVCTKIVKKITSAHAMPHVFSNEDQRP